jgi:hypothetical protein
MTITAPARTGDPRLGPAPRAYAEGDTRDQLLDDWNRVIEFLRDHPEIPVPLALCREFRVPATGAVELDRLAGHLGIPATHNKSVHRAVKTFGLVDLVIYKAALGEK